MTAARPARPRCADWRPACLSRRRFALARSRDRFSVSRAVQGGDRATPSASPGRTESNPTSASPGCSPDRGLASSRSSFTARVAATNFTPAVCTARCAIAKYRDATWTIEAGDAYFSPGVGDTGSRISSRQPSPSTARRSTGRTARSSISVSAGRTTAWRSIFGNDPQALGQTLASRSCDAPAASLVLELNARASRVRTSSLEEFSYTIDAGDQVGGGARLGLAPSLQLVADGSLVSYRRTGLRPASVTHRTWRARTGCIRADGCRSICRDSLPGIFPR